MKIKDLRIYLRKLKTLLLDILFPIECLGCGKEGVWLCDECLTKIPINQTDSCVVCKRFSEYGKTHPECRHKAFLDGIIIVCPWESKLLQDAIHKYKYKFIQNLSYPLSRLLIVKLNCHPRKGGDPGMSDADTNIKFTDKGEQVRESYIHSHSRQPWIPAFAGMTRGNARIVPVPLHKRRLRWRGFNQAELLAEKITDHLQLKVDNQCLARKKHTTPQMSLKRRQRLDNLVNAFKITEHGQHKIQQGVKNFLLIDDVLTTGTTMNECGQILKKNGAKGVWGMVLARG